MDEIDTPAAVIDNRAVPGSFEKTPDGFIRTDEPTAPGTLAGPELDLASAQAIADANEASGFPTPPEVQAVIDAGVDAAAQARAAAKVAAAAARAAASANATGQTPKTAAPSAAETKE